MEPETEIQWSPWLPLEEAARVAPLKPGVYVARERLTHQIVYIGMAGERRGRGLRDRLRVYLTGKAAVSGLGEAALDRALADHAWLSKMIQRTRVEGPLRTKQWAQAALTRADLELRWFVTPDKASALVAEQRLIALAEAQLWNRRR
ncbi:hypothetical protein ACQPXM_34340 [Kribbella sp. CA-253562]|uniref:hypothetical protein n=1 Tax=Kribbella sp. CA-253562 TaxID=3239942 RepID=UPI003D909AF5